MWIPHFGFILWPHKDTKKEDIAKSEKDKALREFEVQFELESSDARTTGKVAIELQKETRQKLTDGTGKSGSVIFEPTRDHQLKRIIAIFESTNRDSAVEYAYNVICHHLSFWSLMYGISIGVWAIVVYDRKHNTAWEATPQRPQPEKLVIPAGLAFSEQFIIVLSLYREGRNSSSPYYRFLCFYKILEAFYERREAFRAMDELLKANPVVLKRKTKRVTDEMLIFALVPTKQRGTYKGMTLGALFKHFDAYHRAGIAHVYPTGTAWTNLDDFATYTEYVWLSNLAEQAARLAITDEIDLWTKANKAGIVKIK